MCIKKVKEKLFNFFDKNVYKTFDEVILEIPKCAEALKLSEFKELYRSWRKEYIAKSEKNEYMTLNDFCYLKATNSKSFTSAQDIKAAIYLKQQGTKMKEISKITGLTVGRLYDIFSDAHIRGIEVSKRSLKGVDN